MICRDYHMHTSFCDGSNTAEEMIQAAVDQVNIGPADSDNEIFHFHPLI